MTKSFDAEIKPTGNKIRWEAFEWGVRIWVNDAVWGMMTYLGNDENHEGIAIDSWYGAKGDIYVNSAPHISNEQTSIDIVFKESGYGS